MPRQVIPYVFPQPLLERFVRRIPHPLQWTVEGVEVEPVGRIGHRGGDQHLTLRPVRGEAARSPGLLLRDRDDAAGVNVHDLHHGLEHRQ